MLFKLVAHVISCCSYTKKVSAVLTFEEAAPSMMSKIVQELHFVKELGRTAFRFLPYSFRKTGANAVTNYAQGAGSLEHGYTVKSPTEAQTELSKVVVRLFVKLQQAAQARQA